LHIVKHDYTANQEGQISLSKGAIVHIIAKKDNGWWFGSVVTATGGDGSNNGNTDWKKTTSVDGEAGDAELEDGESGWMPASYLRLAKNEQSGSAENVKSAATEEAASNAVPVSEIRRKLSQLELPSTPPPPGSVEENDFYFQGEAVAAPTETKPDPVSVAVNSNGSEPPRPTHDAPPPPQLQPQEPHEQQPLEGEEPDVVAPMTARKPGRAGRRGAGGNTGGIRRSRPGSILDVLAKMERPSLTLEDMMDERGQMEDRFHMYTFKLAKARCWYPGLQAILRL